MRPRELNCSVERQEIRDRPLAAVRERRFRRSSSADQVAEQMEMERDEREQRGLSFFDGGSGADCRDQQSESEIMADDMMILAEVVGLRIGQSAREINDGAERVNVGRNRRERDQRAVSPFVRRRRG